MAPTVVAVLALMAVSVATLTVITGQLHTGGSAARPLRLYLRCLRWGVATGAATGAFTGAFVIVASGGARTWGLDLVLVGALYGALAGIVVSVIPTVLGGLVISALISRRHPDPSPHAAIAEDLSVAFAIVVALLDLALLLLLFADGVWFSSWVRSLCLVLVDNGCVVLMLWWARGSISRSWS